MTWMEENPTPIGRFLRSRDDAHLGDEVVRVRATIVIRET